MLPAGWFTDIIQGHGRVKCFNVDNVDTDDIDDCRYNQNRIQRTSKEPDMERYYYQCHLWVAAILLDRMFPGVDGGRAK